ncbi:MAG: PilZ domain-containing protein [Myxococcales bacterium]|nr:PilZ domain-containing protein [Myxococcales bacterium]
MPLSIAELPSRRRAPRRAVDLECEVRSSLWDGALPFQVRDLSPVGMWLDTSLPLDEGDEVLLSFRPPRWSEAEWPLIARGAVARVGLHRRRHDARPSGMGLSFKGLEPGELCRLEDVLIGLPLPVPPSPLPQQQELPIQALRLPDGRIENLVAEAPLLTSRAPRPQQLAATPTAPTVRRGRSSRRYVPRAERLARRPHLRLVS